MSNATGPASTDKDVYCPSQGCYWQDQAADLLAALEKFAGVHLEGCRSFWPADRAKGLCDCPQSDLRAAIAAAHQGEGTTAEPVCPTCGWPATRNPWGGAGRCPDSFHAAHQGEPRLTNSGGVVTNSGNELPRHQGEGTP